MDVILHHREGETAVASPIAIAASVVGAFAGGRSEGSSLRSPEGTVEMAGTNLVLLARISERTWPRRLRIVEDLGPSRAHPSPAEMRERVLHWTTVLAAGRPAGWAHEETETRRAALVRNALDARYPSSWAEAVVHPGTELVAPRITARRQADPAEPSRSGSRIEEVPLTAETAEALTDRTTVHVSLVSEGDRIDVEVGRAPPFAVRHGGPLAELHRRADAAART